MTAVIAAATKAVVAICVLLVPPVAVGAVGVPVRAGDASGAFAASAASSPVTSDVGWLCADGAKLDGFPVTPVHGTASAISATSTLPLLVVS